VRKNLFFALLVISLTFSICKATASQGVFDKIHQQALAKNWVKEITYAQFIEIRNSNEEFILLDVRNNENYNSGHIKGAISTTTKDFIEKVLSKLNSDSKIIVYGDGFSSQVSTIEARDLLKFGYTKVLDYKGGIEEWKEKGNSVE